MGAKQAGTGSASEASLVFVYGGITITDMAMLFVCHGIVAAFTGGIGMFYSSLFKRSTIATVCAYATIVILAAGTYALNVFAYRMDMNEINTYLNALNASARQASSGGFIYLLLLNPAVTFFAVITRQAGSGNVRLAFEQWFGAQPDNAVTAHWIPVSLCLQLLAAVVLIAAAVHTITPVHKGRKGSGKAVVRGKAALRV